MDSALEAILGKLQGGEIEVRNVLDNYGSHGQIKSLNIAEKAGCSTLLHVELDWNTAVTSVHKTTGAPIHWIETLVLSYSCALDMPVADAPNRPLFTVSKSTVIIDNPVSHEATWLYAKGVYRLPHDAVTWLPAGPKAFYGRWLADKGGGGTSIY